MNKRLKLFGVFLIFFLITFIIYLPTIHAKFVFDFIDIAIDFRKFGLFGENPFSKGVSPFMTTRIIGFIIFHFFRYNPWAWHFFCSLLHAVNVFLFFLFLKELFRYFNYNNSYEGPLVASFCFLFLPYHTEVIVWLGALNYLIVGLFIFFHLYTFLRFLLNGGSKMLLLSTLSLLAAAFSHELGLFLLPADIILSLAVLQKVNLKALFIYLIVIVGYAINKIFSGEIVGHYGAETHLRFHVTEIVPALYKYVLKILFLSGFYSVDRQTRIYDILQRPIMVYGLLAITIIGLTVMTVFLVIRKGRFAVAEIMLLFFVIFIFPVLNLYFPYWINIHADRYCYISGAFLIAAAISVLFRYDICLIRNILPIIYVCFSIYFLEKDINSWKNAGKMEASLEKDFRWWNSEHIYILNLPDNFRGAYMYRGKQPSLFAASFIKSNRDSILNGKITEILGYNLNDWQDSVVIEKIDNSKLKVTLSSWGIWLWRNTKGAADYENDFVKVKVADDNHSYIVDFKNKKDNDVYIYAANGKWRQLKGF